MPIIGTFGSISARGLRPSGAGGALYAFTSHTFTTAGLSGATGPNLTQLRSAYSSQTWAQDSAFLNVTSTGIQNWTVPETADYTIDVIGARGGTGSYNSPGNGGRMTGTISLEAGEILYIIVGQTANNASGGWGGGGQGGQGGGGASDVRRSAATLSDRIIVGGGGGGDSSYSGNDANAQNGGFGGYPNGGSSGYFTTPSGYGIYGGYGASQSSGGSGGDSNGGAGSFGQGGNGASGVGGGGGGGYYGGGGGGYWTPGANTASPGGGGSSYYNQSLFSSVTNTSGYNSSGNGSITITKL